MKRNHLFTALLLAAASISGTSCVNHIDEAVDETTQSPVEKLQHVRVCATLNATHEPMSRATTAAIADYCQWFQVYLLKDGAATLLAAQDKSQLKPGEALGELTLSLPVGQHQLAFVASRGEAALSSPTLTWQRVYDTFHCTATINVNPSATGTATAVTLQRISGQVVVRAIGCLPESVKSVQVVLSQYRNSIDLSTGCSPTSGTPYLTNYAKQWDVSNDRHDLPESTYATNLFFPSSGETTLDVSVSVHGADGSTLNSITADGVQCFANQRTILEGNIYNLSHAVGSYITYDWKEDIVVPL